MAGELASLFGSHVIGVCAVRILDLLSDQGSAIRKEPVKDRAAVEKDLEKCADDFRASIKGRASSWEWRSAISFDAPAEYAAAQARSADLIISRAAGEVSMMDDSDCADVSRLAIRVGRPLLLVPDPAPEMALRRAIIAWKNVREAKRAVLEGLPFLQLAESVTLLSVTGEGQRLDAENQLKDVSQWLGAHGVAAERAVVSTTASQGRYLHAELLNRRCDFLVAGAYGRTRLDEWVFGGVTRNILLQPEQLTLVSH